MNIEMITISVLWTFLFIYVIVAAIEFGIGFFAYYGRATGKDTGTRRLTKYFESYLPHLTNFFLVFFIIGLIGLYPEIWSYFTSALFIPSIVVILLFLIRIGIHTLYIKGEKDGWFLLFAYGISGLLIPAALATVMTISEGGFIRHGSSGMNLLAAKLFLSPYSWSVVFLAMVSVLFISATFLIYYWRRAENKEAEKTVREFALLWSIPTLIASMLVIVSLRGHNVRHYNNALDVWWLFGLSLLFFLGAVYLIAAEKKTGLAFTFVVLQFLFAFFGYGISHLPYILDPFILVHSFNKEGMVLSLCFLFIAGICLLFPVRFFIQTIISQESSDK